MANKLYYDDKGSTFKEAFADARKEGKKIFEWNGKEYNTDLKSPKASMDEGLPKKTRADEKVGKGYEDVGKSSEDKEDKRSRGTAAALASTGVGLGAAALLGGMKKSEEQRKERELAKGKEERATRSPVRSISTEDAASEGYRKGGKVSSASKRADGIAQRGKTRGKIV